MARAKKEKKLTPEEQALVNEAAEVEVLTPDEYRVIRAANIWGHDDTGFDLTLEEQLFVRSYMIDRNPIAALRRLGYGDEPLKLKKLSDKYLADAGIRGAIEVLGKRMMEKLSITAEKIQQRLAAVAFFDPREVMEFDHNGVKMLHSRFWTKEQAMAIQSVKPGQTGVELKLYDGLKATEMLAKQIGLQPDETPEAAAAAARAAGEAVVDRIMSYFDKVVPDDPQPPIEVKALPVPDETKH